jgi:hypothetical protein
MSGAIESPGPATAGKGSICSDQFRGDRPNIRLDSPLHVRADRTERSRSLAIRQHLSRSKASTRPSLFHIYEMAPDPLSNSYASIGTLAVSVHDRAAAKQQQQDATSMTAMSMRHGLPTSARFWAEGNDNSRQSVSVGRGAPSASRDGRTLRRPDASILNEAIPLVAIGRNQAGFWVARDCDSSTGRAFIFKGSAIRFAKRIKGRSGCALMFVNEGLELELGDTGASQFTQLANIARNFLVWKARLRRFVRRVQGRTSLKP